MPNIRDDQAGDNKPHAVTYFDIWDPWRESIIEQHRFYVDQGRKKLLSQFSNMEQESEEAAERWLEKRSEHFDPDRDDPGSLEEDAHHEGIEFYRLLSELRDQVRLSIVAGMYHTWDKELRRWLLKEIGHWHRGVAVTERVWQATHEEIAELLDASGIASRDADHLQKLSACRYVVNVYKHGEGLSLEKLKNNYSEFLQTSSFAGVAPDVRQVDYTHLFITDEHFDQFSNAIITFWRMIPSRIKSRTLNMPKWFQRAMEKDRDIV
ncbi:hypothetical protein [Pseudomonas palmensis]|uniref:hypothetical protein n=1 Tax=Pseudomonas palmensis TaxID=2815362 RepID=UPI001AEB3B4A|nr:hypothetical protein [Pseudomonas palmensis]